MAKVTWSWWLAKANYQRGLALPFHRFRWPPLAFNLISSFGFGNHFSLKLWLWVSRIISWFFRKPERFLVNLFFLWPTKIPEFNLASQIEGIFLEPLETFGFWRTIFPGKVPSHRGWCLEQGSTIKFSNLEARFSRRTGDHYSARFHPVVLDE